MAQRRLRVQDYTVGWVCALPIELAAATKMLDEEHQELPRDDNDTNLYTFGRICGHNVVIVCLPTGQTGTNSAAAATVEMKSKFTRIRFGLMVGIGGGVPSAKLDVRLGDVVISQPNMQHGGVVQYDFGKTRPSGFTRTGFLNTPPTILLNALSRLQANHDIGRDDISIHLSAVSQLPKFAWGNTGPDILFKSTYKHIEGPTCAQCSKDRLIERPQRLSQEIIIHYGTIASGNQVIRDGLTRDRLSSELGGVICFEMEAAGLMNSFPCLVIRGICDYADSHKNKSWQPYAAATAAACAKEILSVIPPAEVIRARTVNEAIEGKEENDNPIDDRLLAELPSAAQAASNSYEVADAANQIHSFQETRGVSGIRGLHPYPVGPDFSSKLYLRGKTVESVEGNHRNMIRFESENEPRYRAISTVLKKNICRDRDESPARPQKLVFMVPFPRDAMFIGREDILDQIVRGAEHESDSHTRIALVGLGGIGKSQVAIEYAYRVRAHKPQLIVLWIHASTPTRFEQGYRDFARKADLQGRDNPEIHILELVRDWLSNEDNGQWLMVLDNIDNDSDWFLPGATLDNSGEKQAPLEVFLPQSSNGTILVTSRNSVTARKLLGDYGRPVYVERMLEDDALNLLRSKVRFEETLDEDARALVHALEGIPLAITQAAAYIKTRERFDVPRYLRLFHESETNIAILLNNEDSMQDLRRDPSTRVPVITTWQITIDKIREIAPYSANLLALMSMFDQHEIPKGLLDKGLNALQFEEHIAPLMSYSLVSEQTQKDNFGMHRLVQLATRAWLMKNDDLWKWKSEALKIMAEIFPAESLLQFQSWSQCQALLPHTKGLVTNIPVKVSSRDVRNIAIILKSSAWYILERNGQYKVAEKTLRDAFGLSKQYLGLEDRTTIQCLGLISSVLRIQQQLDQAELIGRQALELCEQHLGPDDMDRAKAQSRLSLILLRKKKYEEAESLLKKAQAFLVGKFGSKDSYSNRITANLASVLASQNRYDEAEPLSQQALKDMEQLLGDDHPDTLIHRDKLAGILEKRQKYDQAEELYRRILGVRKEVLGPNHPRTLATIRSFVRVLEKQGKQDEALPLRPKAEEAIIKGYDDSI